MVSEIKRFAQQMKRAKDDLERSADSEARAAGRRYAWNAKISIAKQDANASGELFRGIGYQSIAAGHNRSQVRLRSSAEHSGYVEHGTGTSGDGTYPENPDVPVRIIKQWGDIKPTFQWRQNPWGAAAAIAENISEDGTDPQPFFWDNVDTSFDMMVLNLRDDLHEAL